MQGIYKKQQVQSQIHSNIYIFYNNINLLAGRRWSDKTYNVIRETIKICILYKNGLYSSFAIISDNLKIIQTDYDHAYDVLNEIIEAKKAYDYV
jgi:hypothetical protein